MGRNNVMGDWVKAIHHSVIFDEFQLRRQWVEQHRLPTDWPGFECARSDPIKILGIVDEGLNLLGIVLLLDVLYHALLYKRFTDSESVANGFDTQLLDHVWKVEEYPIDSVCA